MHYPSVQLRLGHLSPNTISTPDMIVRHAEIEIEITFLTKILRSRVHGGCGVKASSRAILSLSAFVVGAEGCGLLLG